MIDFRLGDYRDVMQDVTCDVLLTDPPYSDKTHKGRRTGSEIRQSGINYQSITEADAIMLANFWRDRCRWWAAIFCDHISRQWHSDAWESVGWYVFGPVRWIKPNGSPRMSGDGPTVSSEDILVARPKHRLPENRAGSRPGHYIFGTETGGDPNHVTGKSFPGKKPAALMNALILDYSLPGDIIADPHTGSGTTLISASSLGRKPVGSEVIPETYERAKQNIAGGHTLDMLEAIA